MEESKQAFDEVCVPLFFFYISTEPYIFTSRIYDNFDNGISEKNCNKILVLCLAQLFSVLLLYLITQAVKSHHGSR